MLKPLANRHGPLGGFWMDMGHASFAISENAHRSGTPSWSHHKLTHWEASYTSDVETGAVCDAPGWKRVRSGAKRGEEEIATYQNRQGETTGDETSKLTKGLPNPPRLEPLGPMTTYIS